MAAIDRRLKGANWRWRRSVALGPLLADARELDCGPASVCLTALEHAPPPNKGSFLCQTGQYLPLKISATGEHRSPMIQDGPPRSHHQTARIAAQPRLTIGPSLSQNSTGKLSVDFGQALAASQPQIAKI